MHKYKVNLLFLTSNGKLYELPKVSFAIHIPTKRIPSVLFHIFANAKVGQTNDTISVIPITYVSCLLCMSFASQRQPRKHTSALQPTAVCSFTRIRTILRGASATSFTRRPFRSKTIDDIATASPRMKRNELEREVLYDLYSILLYPILSHCAIIESSIKLTISSRSSRHK